MFPLNWNFPFRKKDGTLVKIQDAMTSDVDALKTRVETLEGTVGGNSRDIDSLETFTGALQDQINPDEYSEDEAYTVGDYVIHGNKLYKCNTSCTADTWENNSSYFTETSVADELTAINSDLNSKITNIGTSCVFKFIKAGLTGDVTAGQIADFGSIENKIPSGYTLEQCILMPVANTPIIMTYYGYHIYAYSIAYTGNISYKAILVLSKTN